ncbi:MAG: hypothetical protein ACRDU5_20610 [Mycobacterium sp.]
MFELIAFSVVVLLLVAAAGLPYPHLPYPQTWHKRFGADDL